VKTLTSLLCALVVVLSGCSTAPSNPVASIASAEHWVSGVSGLDRSPIRLYLWEKRLVASDPLAKPGKIILLVHGVGTPSRIVFDLQVPGKGAATYSLMDYLANQGFDVFSLEFQNYGRSDKHACGLCVNTQVAASDVNAAVDYIKKLRGVDKVNLLGWSWGAHVIGLFTTQHPQKVQRLILYAPPLWSGPRGKVPTAEFRTLNPDNLRAGFEPLASEPIVVDTYIKEVGQWSPQVPNGALVDLNSKMPLTDPKQIGAPTMIIVGALDRVTPITEPNLPGFFAALPNPDKQLSIIPAAGHAMVVQKPRLRIYTEVAKWFALD